MTNTTIQLTEEEFDDRYRLVPNHLNPNASWAYGEDDGCLFETYGKELEFVRQQDPRTVWTFVDGDDGDQYLISGYHLVNRVGYLITTTPVPEEVEIEVRIPMPTDEYSDPGEPEDVPPSTPDLLARIARQHLQLPTLETRRSDRQDFHDLAVWCVKDALQAAYEAGQRRAAPKLQAALKAFLEADALAEECGEWKWENLDHAFQLARSAIVEAEAAGIATGPGAALTRETPAPAETQMYDTLRYVAEMLSGLKPDFLRDIGLDVALEKTSAALDAFEARTRACPGATVLAKTSPQAPRDESGLPIPFDAYEVHGVREFEDDQGKYCEQVPDAEAEYWSLYGHIPGQGVECIGDFKTRDAAEEVFARIVGRRYTGTVPKTGGADHD